MLLSIGLEVAVSIVALIIWKAPLSWSFRKVSISVPQEVRDSIDEIFESLSHASRSSFRVAEKSVPKILPIPKQFEVLKCPICGISGDGLVDHLVSSGHGFLKDYKTSFVTKLGSPYDIDDTPTAGVYRLVLKSGDALPKWADENRPIRIDIEGDTIVYWVKFDGLRHIK